MDHPSAHWFAKTLGKIPLRTLLIVPFVLQTVGVVALVGYLSYRSGQAAVENLADQLMTEVSNGIKQHLDSYLGKAQESNRTNLAMIESGILDLNDFNSLGKYFYRQMRSLNFAYANFGSKDGAFIGAGYGTDNALEIVEIPQSAPNKLFSYSVDNQGNRLRLITTIKNPQTNNAAWYLDAVRAGKPIWSSVYTWGDLPDHISISASAPVYDSQKKLLGVLGIDLELSQISQFLKTINNSRSGNIFIMDCSGLIVASSGAESPAPLVNGKAQRLAALKSREPLISKVTKDLIGKFGSLQAIKNPQLLRPSLKENPFVRVTPYRDSYGLDWLVVTVIPESEFMGQIHANAQRTLLLRGLALLLAIVTGNLTASWIAQPILSLNTAVKQLAKGDFVTPTVSTPVSEFRELTDSFAEMAQHLQASLEELATQKAYLAHLLEILPVGVAIHTTDGSATYFNQQAQQLLATPPIPGVTVNQLPAAYQIYIAETNELYPIEELPVVRALQGESCCLENLEVERAGTRIAFKAQATPIFNAEGEVIRAIVIFEDITLRKAAEKILLDYYDKLEQDVQQSTLELKQEIQERRQLEVILRQYERVVSASRDCFSLIDRHYIYRLINETYLLWNDKRREEILGHSVSDLLGEEFFQRNIKPLLDRCLSGETGQIVESWINYRGMGLRYVRAIYAPYIELDGTISGVVINVHDLTDLKLAEQALRESESRYRQVVQQQTDFILRSQPDTAITFANEALCYALGLPLEQVKGQKWLDFANPDDLQSILQHLTLLTPEDPSFISENRDHRADGQIGWTQWINQGIFDEQGQMVEIQSVGRDITALKQVQAELSESKHFIEQVADYSPQILYILNPITWTNLYVNRQSLNILGYTPEEFQQGDSQFFLDILHPDDLPLLLRNRSYWETAPDSEILTTEYRMRHKNGSWRWLRSQDVVFARDENHQVSKILGTAQDISEQQAALRERKEAEIALKQAQYELKEKNEKLEKLVNTDPLTQIANRRCFEACIQQEWLRLCREQKPLSLLLFDVDYFKRYNDNYGHPDGDKCLFKIAQAAAQSIRRPADLVGRYGGEEFIVILPNTDLEGAKAIAEKIHLAIKALKIPHQLSEVNGFVTISLGITSLIPTVNLSVAIAIKQADQALLLAKLQGRNQSVVFSGKSDVGGESCPLDLPPVVPLAVEAENGNEADEPDEPDEPDEILTDFLPDGDFY